MAKIDNFEIDTIYNEDCLATMKRMPDNFIDLTVTSPPYDNLRDYHGYSFDFENVAKELYRVTKDGGVVVWIVADATIKGDETGTSFRQALFFKECGFNLLDTMIYIKANYAPMYPTARRYANQFEYMFILSKGKHKCFTPVQRPKARNKREAVAYRQKDGSLKRKVKEAGRETKDASNVWTYSVGGNSASDKIAFEHPAIFPEKLVADHIVSWSNEGDVVYDCFLGSGTTAIVADRYNRHFIGSEISKEYFDIAERRIKLEQAQLSLF